MFIENTLLFLSSLTLTEFISYFWPFIFFDFVRYVILDLFIIFFYLPARYFDSANRRRAKLQLFRQRPLVSVIVPGKNEGKHIPRLAVLLKNQTYKHLELIIVDDGSDDDTELICRKLESEGFIKKFIRNDQRGGKASAANTALNFASGEFIVHIDADSYLSDNSIETILTPFFLDSKIGAVGGDVRVANIESSMATRLQTIEYMKSISVGRTIASFLGVLRIISGAHGAFRKDILERLHGWDVGPGLDGDITLKFRKLGYRVVHEPDAICYTNVPLSFIRLAKQRYRWDRSLVRFRLRKHVDMLLRPTVYKTRNFLTLLDNLVFNVVLNIKWWIYVVQLLMVAASTNFALYIIVVNYILYFSINVIEFMVACMVNKRTVMVRELVLIPFLPLMPLYTGVFIRLVRSYAYLMEFIFKSSYNDRWNPWKVSKISKQEKM